jgi:hypothetical protein
MLETTSELRSCTRGSKRNRVLTCLRRAARHGLGRLADPWQVGQWWGPKGFTTTILEMDLRAGGKWRLILHGPDGTNYPNEMTFTEVVPWTESSLDSPAAAKAHRNLSTSTRA